MSQPVIDTLVQSGHVHFAMPLPASTAGQILPLTQYPPVATVSLDVGHHVGWLRDPANWRICAAVDHLLPNKNARRSSCVARTPDPTLTSPNATAGEVEWSSLVHVAPRCDMKSTRGEWHPPSVKVVDTTGAGDAFNAGFIDGLLDEATGEECLRRGCVCGSMSTRVAGALGGLPDKREFQDFYEQSYRS